MGDFDEAKHPRVPAGSPSGGEFTTTGGSGGGKGETHAKTGDHTTDSALTTPDYAQKVPAGYERKFGSYNDANLLTAYNKATDPAQKAKIGIELAARHQGISQRRVTPQIQGGMVIATRIGDPRRR